MERVLGFQQDIFLPTLTRKSQYENQASILEESSGAVTAPTCTLKLKQTRKAEGNEDHA